MLPRRSARTAIYSVQRTNLEEKRRRSVPGLAVAHFKTCNAAKGAAQKLAPAIALQVDAERDGRRRSTLTIEVIECVLRSVVTKGDHRCPFSRRSCPPTTATPRRSGRRASWRCRLHGGSRSSPAWTHDSTRPSTQG